MSAHYHIYSTCPALYNKIIGRVVKQLKKDRVDFSILEVDMRASTPRAATR